MQNEQFDLIAKLIKRELTIQEKEKLQNFEQLFKIYNSHTNLVSKNDEKKFFEKHIFDSLALSLFLNKYDLNEGASILDVGTGGGFPSIPASIIFPQYKIYPLDSIAKKIGFIELVQKELRLENLHPICKRVEDLSAQHKASFDAVTSRAVTSLNILLEYTIPFLKKGCCFAAYKSKIADEEIDNAQNALSVLNSKIIERISYNLPGIEEHTRELIIIKKLKNTSGIYPRKSNQSKKNPL